MGKNTAMSPDSLKRLEELTEKKLAGVTGFLELTKAQSAILAEDDIDVDLFTKNLTGRQAYIDSVNGLHNELEVLMQSFAQSKDMVPSATAARLEAMQGSIEAALKEAAGIDERNRAAANEKLLGISTEAKKAQLNRKGLTGYLNQGAYLPGSGLFDKKQ